MAVVVIIAAISVYYLAAANAGTTLSFTAENGGDNIVVKFLSGTTEYVNNWEWAVVVGGVGGTFTTESTDIRVGSTVVLNTGDAITANTSDKLRIRIGTTIYDQTITDLQ